MNLGFVRSCICIFISLCLFVACNQSRHIVSDKIIKADQAWYDAHKTKIEQLQKKAKSLIGKPYLIGSAGPKAFDCSGFTSFVYQAIQLSLPRMSADQAKTGTALKLALVRPGDLVFFGNRKIDHVAMVSQVQGKLIRLIHATSTHGVIEQVLQDSDYWMHRVRAVRRVIY
jgi:cell wall-associated NlpC family hydrolase